MGNFSNTTYKNTIANLMDAASARLANPYYKFSDKKPTPVTYYNQNQKKSTLDQSSEIHYAHVSTQSALKFNKVNNFYLYGIDRINLDYDVGDNGLEANPITGEAIILPNTIIPADGDFFSIDYIKEPILFKVNSVTIDTLDTGNNIYKIDYQAELVGKEYIDQIEKQVANVFNFYIENVGTEYSCLLSEESNNLISELEELITQLSSFYQAFFFKPKIQTYVYLYNDAYYFYDPFMIEFIRRNKIFPDIYIMHQTHLEVTFPFEYSKSFFYGLEKNNKELFCNNTIATANLITEFNSLFTSRLEDYYELKYFDESPYKTRFKILSDDLIEGVKNNNTYMDKSSIFNIIIDYFNNAENYINESLIDIIHNLDYKDNMTNFYLIPIYIFIIKKYIKSIMTI